MSYVSVKFNFILFIFQNMDDLIQGGGGIGRYQDHGHYTNGKRIIEDSRISWFFFTRACKTAVKLSSLCSSVIVCI